VEIEKQNFNLRHCVDYTTLNNTLLHFVLNIFLCLNVMNRLFADFDATCMLKCVALDPLAENSIGHRSGHKYLTTRDSQANLIAPTQCVTYSHFPTYIGMTI
jgi:hypothetical protein